MSHPIIDGPVLVLKVATPGAYWIKCNACDDSSRVPSSIRRKPISNDYYYHLQGDKVFARDEDGFFYRGIICGRRAPRATDVPMYWKYVVQLIDTFQVKDFNQDDVYPSYGESSAACASAHLVSLYQVFPQMPPSSYGKCVKINSVEHKAFEKSVVDWDRFIVSMAHLTGQVSFVQSKTIKGSIYGQISITPPLMAQNGTLCNELSEYLYFEKLAVPMTFQFEHVVQALMANPLTDSSKLLAAFDPFGEVTSKKTPVPPLEKLPEPVEPDFNGFRVHPEDVMLHLSLISNNHYTNIIYKDIPPERDIVVRYLRPDGVVVLGTVLNFNVHFVEELSLNGCFSMPIIKNSISLSVCESDGERTNTHYPNKMFEKLPPESNEPAHPLLSYDLDESLRNFQAAGNLFKERVLPYPFSPPVEEFILHHLESMGVNSLHEWQKLCLPTFSCRKNLLVIGPKSMSKLTTATVSALSWMTHVSDSTSNSIHPQLIIFFRDFKRADKTAIFCNQLTNFRVIVSTSAFISKKQKEMATQGCDILITTPSNCVELVFQKVFNFSRLRHVIFDEFDVLHQTYTEELVNIFEALGSFTSTRVQIVAVANSWGSIVTSERIRRKVEFSTVCIMGAIHCCCYLGLAPKVVFVQNYDSIKHIENLVFEKDAKKHLLMCKDEKEGISILEKIPASEHVRFIHENLDKDTALTIVEEWENFVTNRDKLLVCTDRCFEKLGSMKDVTFEVMVSWMTNCWDILSSRFRAYSRDIGSMRNLTRASAYVLCDCEQYEQLLLIKNISCSVHFVNGALDEHLSRVSIQADREKLADICPSLFMIGKCNDFSVCPLRHVFLPDDGPEVMHFRQFLNVEVLKVHNAFRYSVRVIEIVSNSDPTFNKMPFELKSNLDEIQYGLAKSPRKPCPPTLCVGQMVGACIDRKGDALLRRLMVESVPQNGPAGLYTLSVIDFEEPDVILPFSQLFTLPEKVVKYPKDVIDLYITGLLPVDFRSDWLNDTFSYVTALLNQILKESNFLAGRVQIVFANRSVLVESLYCFRYWGLSQKTMVSISNSEFSSLKELILESGYCVKNDAHLALLLELLKSATLGGPSPFSLPLDPEGWYGFRADLPTHPVPAVVSSYDDPGLFYVQLVDEFEKLAEFEETLSSTLERCNQQLPLIAIDELCAIRYEGAWNRAIIFDITGDLETSVESIHVLFLDYGNSIVDVQPQELYRLPDDFVSVPFFAIQCELFGARPNSNEEWHEKAIEEFRTHVRTRDDEMERLTVEFRGNKQSSNSFWKYLVILAKQNDPDFIINTHLGRRGFAKLDQTFKLPVSSIHRSFKKLVLVNGVVEKNAQNSPKFRANWLFEKSKNSGW